jgi:hypothetical protein
MSPSIKRCLALLTVLSLLVLNPGCSDDSVSPEPEPEPLEQITAIAYHDGVNRDVRYVEKTGEFWGDPEVVHYESDQGRYLSLAFDARGTPHISYYNANVDDGNLMYAVRTEYGWRRGPVDRTANAGMHSSIALDPQGKPHIVYQRNDAAGAKLMYASHVSDGLWDIEEVTGAIPANDEMPTDCHVYRAEWGFPITLAIDASGAPHISYVASDGCIFSYATKPANGDWEISQPDPLCGGYGASIALDSQGNPHISYVVNATKTLKHAWKIDDNPWQEEDVTDGASGCWYPTSLALDASDAPHISYFTGLGTLGYAMKPAGGGWVREIADDGSEVGRYCSLVLDTQGTPCISYWDYPNDDLKCAVRFGNNQWAQVIVDDAPNVGMYTSIAMIYR